MHQKKFWIETEDDEMPWVEPSQWLSHHMAKKKITDMELLNRITELGFEGTSRINVLNWRKGLSQIPPEAFPRICSALGLTPFETDRLTCDVLKQVFPGIKEYIRNPDAERATRILAMLKQQGRERKRTGPVSIQSNVGKKR